MIIDSVKDLMAIRQILERLKSKAATGKQSRFSIAGHSDPVVLNGRAIAQRIKGTPGITG